MFYNYLKTAWRNIIKRRSISVLNVLSLSIGITACILILGYVKYEKSYDDFHPDLDQLFRLNLGMTNAEGSHIEFRATNHPAAGIYLKKDFPVVQSFARLVDVSIFYGSAILSCESETGMTSFYEEDMFIADSAFLTMFGFDLISGIPQTALKKPEHVVLTQSLAKRFFGEEDPMGRTMKLNNQDTYVVNGIMKDPPPNTHFQISALFSASGFSNGLNNAWIWPEFHTYVKVTPDADISRLKQALDPFVDKYLGDVMEEFGIEEKMALQPVKNIHLDGNLLKEVTENGDRSRIVFMMIIALMILAVAWINYINLSTSRLVERATEIGIRKVIGASRKSVISQLLIESALINFLAILLSLILLAVISPYSEYFTKSSMQGTDVLFSIFRDQETVLVLLGLFLAGILFAGVYPAIVLSSFRPHNTLKGRIFAPAQRFGFRHILVVFQFTIGIIMMAGTFIVFSQVSFMRSHDIGLNIDQLLIVKAPSIVDSSINLKMELLKERILQYSDITHLAVSSDIPGHLIQNNNSIKRKEQYREESFFATFLAIDESFVPTYELDIIAGRNFIKDRELDRSAVILNDRAVRALGYSSLDEVVGETITYKDDQQWKDGVVLGVVKDFNHRSLAYQQEPFVLFNRPYVPYDYYAMKVHTRDLTNTVAKIETVYTQIFPRNPFDHFFLDDYFDQQYRADRRFGWIFGFFACLAILVACLGLIGLVAHITTRKAKEAGMRKILGASTFHILVLFGKQFVWLILIAATIAIPAAWWSGYSWMQSYAYQYQLSLWLFLIPVAIVLLLSILTIIWQSSKVAWVNPAEVLRD